MSDKGATSVDRGSHGGYEPGGRGRYGGTEGGATWIPCSSAVTRVTELDGRGGHYTTKGEPSGSRDSGATGRGASRTSDFYRSSSTGLCSGPTEGCGVPQVVRAPRQAAFTTTKVPRFDGTTSWEQYKQVFDAVVSLNGWDNDTAALQLFSHLKGDALNVALLVPLSRWLSRTGLVGALSAHYGSPGRLADYRVGWRITGDSLRRPLEQRGRTPPYLSRLWRHLP